MTSKRWGTILIAAAMLLTLVLGGAGAVVAQPTSSHTAQTYSFSVPTLLMQVAIQTDGSVNIVYDITFDNFGSPIDIVDIGTPTDNYDVNEMQASIDGHALTDIRPSEYIDTGVEVHLDGYAIPTGATGTLHLAFSIPDMVYADTTNQDNASLQITPTWFDSSLVSGTGNIEIRIATLPGIQPDEVLYQDQPFTDKYQDEQGRVVAVWQFESVSPTKAYRVGISFPQRGITNVIKVTFWDLLGRWLVGAVSVVGGAIGACAPLAAPLIVIFVIARAVIRGSKPNYLPPIAQVEGGGIKRGLTAPEAAAILELPLTKVLGLVIFGMLEKGLIRQTKPDPLTVEVVEDFRVADKSDLKDEESRNRYRRQAAQTKGTVIHQYEYPFLDMIEKHPDTPINKMPVVEAMQSLVDGAAAKMKGFDLSDTQDYYRRVIDRAVEQAAAIGDVEQRQTYLDTYLPWVMMEPNYRPALTLGGYHYWPVWARQTSAAGSGTSVAGAAGRAASAGAGRASTSTTTFGDVSASFAGWAETTMGGMAAAILPTALSKPVASSGSSGGGGSSGCACACAGCACACACAGGGR